MKNQGIDIVNYANLSKFEGIINLKIAFKYQFLSHKSWNISTWVFYKQDNILSQFW